MAATTRDRRSWRPASNDELAWFKVGGSVPAHPTPLELTSSVHAFTYGVTHALESLYFPFYELRPRAIDGQLYLAVVPSGLADRDMDARIGTVSERTIRFKDIRGGWLKEIKPQVEADLERMGDFPPAGASGEQLHEAWMRLRRVRANQWFAPTRAVISPTALLKVGVGDPSRRDEAMAACAEVRDIVIGQGGPAFEAAVSRLGDLLVKLGSLKSAADLQWLEFEEVSTALEQPGAAHQEIAARRKAASTAASEGPATVGAPLDLTDRRLFLLPEILELLGVTSPLSEAPGR